MKKIILSSILLVIVVITSCAGNKKQKTTGVRNIILLIGDGMGTAHVYAIYTANKGQSNILKAQVVGFSKTSSADNYITDSGAGGTAISTGHKTRNGCIAIGPNGDTLITILELAEKNGLSTGLVVTSEITHATPASFIAHQNSRDNYEAIALDLAKSNIDIFIGGGKKYFENRSDSLNISDTMRKLGYTIVYSPDSIDLNDEANTGCLAAPDALPAINSGRGNYLAKSTEIALKNLAKNDKGFFLMVEGSQIDWAAHSNNAEFLIGEMKDFDDAVGKAMNFADNNPGTLVIVTADHETGGVTVTGGDIPSGEVDLTFSTDYHTAVMVPVFAYGTGAEEFAGVYENTELFNKMKKFFGFGD